MVWNSYMTSLIVFPLEKYIILKIPISKFKIIFRDSVKLLKLN